MLETYRKFEAVCIRKVDTHAMGYTTEIQFNPLVVYKGFVMDSHPFICVVFEGNSWPQKNADYKYIDKNATRSHLILHEQIPNPTVWDFWWEDETPKNDGEDFMDNFRIVRWID